jgi:hypothetical protein
MRIEEKTWNECFFMMPVFRIFLYRECVAFGEISRFLAMLAILARASLWRILIILMSLESNFTANSFSIGFFSSFCTIGGSWLLTFSESIAATLSRYSYWCVVAQEANP